MRTMYDSVDASKIPATAQLVAGYVDGHYAWSAADWERFPGLPQVRIAVYSTTDDGNCADVETGDMAPADVVGWVQRRRAAGLDPSVYTSLDNWERVQAAFEYAGEPAPYWWIAAWSGDPTVMAGTIAHQYANGTGYDTSVVADYWPGVDPAPAGSGAPGAVGASAQGAIQTVISRLQAAGRALAGE